jgi:CRP/FNR family cyclic AMP-dependent transcriptional regulator
MGGHRQPVAPARHPLPVLLARCAFSVSRAAKRLEGQGPMTDGDIDMRLFAKKAGTSLNYAAGSIVFNKGDPGECMYVVQSGVIEMVIGDKVIEVCGPNEAIGFMSMIDEAPRSSTARVKDACEVSIIDRRKFRFMVDEVPNFALYIMGAMARRIRGMGRAM